MGAVLITAISIFGCDDPLDTGCESVSADGELMFYWSRTFPTWTFNNGDRTGYVFHPVSTAPRTVFASSVAYVDGVGFGGLYEFTLGPARQAVVAVQPTTFGGRINSIDFLDETGELLVSKTTSAGGVIVRGQASVPFVVDDTLNTAGVTILSARFLSETEVIFYGFDETEFGFFKGEFDSTYALLSPVLLGNNVEVEHFCVSRRKRKIYFATTSGAYASEVTTLEEIDVATQARSVVATAEGVFAGLALDDSGMDDVVYVARNVNAQGRGSEAFATKISFDTDAKPSYSLKTSELRCWNTEIEGIRLLAPNVLIYAAQDRLSSGSARRSWALARRDF